MYNTVHRNPRSRFDNQRGKLYRPHDGILSFHKQYYILHAHTLTHAFYSYPLLSIRSRLQFEIHLWTYPAYLSTVDLRNSFLVFVSFHFLFFFLSNQMFSNRILSDSQSIDFTGNLIREFSLCGVCMCVYVYCEYKT